MVTDDLRFDESRCVKCKHQKDCGLKELKAAEWFKAVSCFFSPSVSPHKLFKADGETFIIINMREPFDRAVYLN